MNEKRPVANAAVDDDGNNNVHADNNNDNDDDNLEAIFIFPDLRPATDTLNRLNY